MTRRQFEGVLFGAGAIVGIAVICGPATAQTNCNTSDLRPVAQGWLPASIGLTLAEKRCQGREFMKELFKSEEVPDTITPSNVLEASRPKLDPAQQRARDEFLAAEKIKLREQREYSEHMRRNMADEAVSTALEREKVMRDAGIEITEPFQKWPDGYDVIAPNQPGGLPTLVQSGKSSSNVDINGDAIILGPDRLQAGTFKDGQLNGVGEEVEENGTWREGNFKSGEMEGPGLEVGKGQDGKPTLLTGNFDNDLPEGQVTITYSGGSRRRQLWDDGQLVSQGPMAEPGSAFADAPVPADTPAMQIYESALEYEMIPAKVGGTLEGTFENNGQPVGEMIRRYADGTSQRELYEGGKVIGRGALSRPGYVPPHIGRVYRPQLPPKSEWKPAPPRLAPRPAPTVVSTGDWKYYSTCSRNYAKLQDWIYRANGITWGARVHSEYMRMWSQCRGSGDPQVEQQYQENAEYLGNYQSRGMPDNSTPGFLNELSRAISDPNYSAELGTVRGQAGGGAGVGGSSGSGGSGNPDQAVGSEDGPAPGTSVGTFDIANPTLPAPFLSKYTARGLSPDTISQQMASDAELRRIEAQLNSTRDAITRLRLLIAKLEVLIVIERQAQDFPGERERIQGMIDSRNQTIKMCQSITSDPSICTAPR